MALTNVKTGGGLPPMMVPQVQTGGGLPPTPVTPPAPTPTPIPVPPLGTPPPVTSTVAVPSSSPVQVENFRTSLAQGNTNAYTQNVQGNQLVSNQLNGLMRQDNQYIQQARDAADQQASGRGMMMSTMAAGASQRAAIDAALPIAQGDAARYGAVADQNMAAVNQDRLADQSTYAQLLGQEVGIRANLDESERSRGFTAQQNDLQRKFTSAERIGTQNWQNQMQQMQNAWQGAQNNAQLQNQLTIAEKQLAADQALKIMEMNFQGSQLDKQLLQQRFGEFDQAVQNQNKMLADTIASIYANPNLSASQQASAVANARMTYQSLFSSYAQVMSAGVPNIFWNPYQLNQQNNGSFGDTGVPAGGYIGGPGSNYHGPGGGSSGGNGTQVPSGGINGPSTGGTIGNGGLLDLPLHDGRA